MNKILLVEDDNYIVTALKEFLGKDDFQVTSVSTYNEAALPYFVGVSGGMNA